jgi:hypothetical protein
MSLAAVLVFCPHAFTDLLPTTQAWAVPRLKPQKTYKFKPKTMLVLSQEFYDQNSSLQNDLVGPFQNPSKINGIQYCGPQQKWHGIDRPAVRSMSTFEEYLERTVNSIRGDSQIAFHPSQVLPSPYILLS